MIFFEFLPTSFSTYPTNCLTKLERLSLASLPILAYCNNLAYCTPLHVATQIKCCKDGLRSLKTSPATISTSLVWPCVLYSNACVIKLFSAECNTELLLAGVFFLPATFTLVYNLRTRLVPTQGEPFNGVPSLQKTL